MSGIIRFNIFWLMCSSFYCIFNACLPLLYSLWSSLVPMCTPKFVFPVFPQHVFASLLPFLGLYSLFLSTLALCFLDCMYRIWFPPLFVWVFLSVIEVFIDFLQLFVFCWISLSDLAISSIKGTQPFHSWLQRLCLIIQLCWDI